MKSFAPSVLVRTLLVLLVLALSPTLAAAQADRLLFLNFAPVEVVEGDDGTVEAFVRWELEGTPQREVRFYVHTDAAVAALSYDDVADPGIDYEPIARTLVVAPASQRSGTVRVRIRGDHAVEPTQRLFVYFTGIVGAETIERTDHSRGGVDIVDDDTAPTPARIILRDDHYLLGTEFGNTSYQLDVLINDTTTDDAPTALTVVQAPAHGTTAIHLPGDVPQQMRIDYTPTPGFRGADRFRYRYCSPGGGCAEAEVTLEVGQFWALDVLTYERSGSHVFGFYPKMAMPSATYAAAPLARTVKHRFRTDTDTSPGNPWDSEQGRAWELVPFPPLAAGEHADWRLAIDIAIDNWRTTRKVDVFIGIDRDGNGRPSRDEVLCTGGDRQPSCEVAFRQSSGDSAYWVMMHSRVPELIDHDVSHWQVAVTAGDGSLVATGPGHATADDPVTLTLAWIDDSMLDRDRRYSVIRIESDDGEWFADVPVWLEYGHIGESATLLVPAQPRTFSFAPGETRVRTFFDVPAGATRLIVETAANADMDYRLVRAAGADAPASADPGSAPATGSAASATGPGGDATLIVEGAALQPGRWFLVTTNVDDHAGEATVQVEIEGTAPVVRPGSYFDAERPGSGLFLYPAGSDWAGLWYTYGGNEKATWYYLQAPAPGAAGVWSSAVYRAAWNGDSRYLTRVGSATITPTAGDAFQLSYTIDGASGTRPQAALGRGCPQAGGSAIDISSHWFDPGRNGTGYSLQTWPDYEYFAAFVYDRQGEPTFLAAEFTGFGGSEASAPLEALMGACPTCDFRHPQRYEAGTLRRRIVGGSLAAIELDARWSLNWDIESTWTGVDAVQLLGGPDSTQGCDP